MATSILATIAVLASLYLARDVLVPVTLAIFLSFLLSPSINWLRHFGMGHTSSVIAVVLALMLGIGALTTVIATQLAGIAASLPQYDKTIQLKLRAIEELTNGRINQFTSQAERTVGHFAPPQPRTVADSTADKSAHNTSPDANKNISSGLIANDGQPVAVQIQSPPPNPWREIQTIASAVWSPLESTGIVMVILIFVLLEREALRDRLIKIVGSADLRATTNAINDAGTRLSRFFISQFMVNLGVGILIGVGLSIFGVPHALLWAILTVVMRFVPFVGVWIAAIFATILAAAVAPGWDLPIVTMVIFVTVELIVSQVIEPQLYGHTTGLSPLAVVVAAIFWSWLWGPLGLVLSTPVTLCLLIAGRHTSTLQLLDVILGDSPALTMPQHLYQRALTGDSDEIITSAQTYIKRKSFAAYCDCVLVPAMQMAAIDFEAGLISQEQGIKVRSVVSSLISTLGDGQFKLFAKRSKTTILDDPNIGRALRREREKVHGRWQGPLNVPRDTIVLCVGLNAPIDELPTEILVRILRSQNIDARHLSNEDLAQPSPPGSNPNTISLCYVVSARAPQVDVSLEYTAGLFKKKFPEAPIVMLYFRDILPQPVPLVEAAKLAANPELTLFDKVTTSYVGSLEICIDWQRDHWAKQVETDSTKVA